MKWTGLSVAAVATAGTFAAMVPMKDAMCIQPIPAGTTVSVYSEPLDTYLRHGLGSGTIATRTVTLNVAGASLTTDVTFEEVSATRLRALFDFGGGSTFQVFTDLNAFNEFTTTDSFTGTGVFLGATGTISFALSGGRASDYGTHSPAADGPKVVEWSMTGTITIPEVPHAAGGGGHTPGYWQNKNGQARIDAADIAALVALHLVNADGSAFDPASKTDVKKWILTDAVNMAFKLSSHLAAMKLNVGEGFVNGGALVYCDTSVDASGQISITALMAAADAALAADPYTPAGDSNRGYQEKLKNALDDANNNLNWVNP